MSKKTPLKNNRLATTFFERLFEISAQSCGKKFLDQFHYFKNQRDHYLQEWWTDEIKKSGESIFREVDYEYLITSLRETLETEPETAFEAQFRFAEVCIQFGEFYKADLLLSYLEREITPDDNKRQARLFILKGLLKGQLNDWTQSQRHYESALQLLSEIDDQDGIAYVYNNLGILASEQWDTKQGVEYFTRAREIVGKQRGHLARNVSMNLAVIQGIRGESDEAMAVFNTLYNDLDAEDHRIRINILINKGVAAKDREDFELAKSVFQQAYDEAQTLPDQRLIGLSALGLADVQIREGNLGVGQNHAIVAFKIFSQLHDRMSLADVYREFGMLHRERGLFELAESQFQISIRMNREFGNLLNLVESYYEYSLLMKIRNDTSAQKEYLSTALSYCQMMRAPRRIERIQQELDAFV